MKQYQNYEDAMHRMGRITGILALTVIFMVPIAICVKFQIWPPAKALLQGIYMVCAIEIPICLGEFFTYGPILGTGGTYLAFVTGNLANMKVPCALMAIDASGYKQGSQEADIIATIAVGSSAIMTVLMIALGVVLMVPLAPVLADPRLAPAFANILPALFGGLGAYWISKNWKIALAPLIFVVLVFLIVPIPPQKLSGILIIVSAFFAVMVSRFLYKKGLLQDKKGGESQ